MQPINQYNGGTGNHDGKFYYQMAEQVKNGSALQADKPFAFRVLTPIIIGTISKIFNTDLLKTFLYVNLFLLFITSLLLFQYWNSLFGLVLFLIPFHNPLRWLYFYPVMVDYLFYLLLVLGLILIKKKEYTLLVWLSFFLVLTREAGLIIPLIVLRKSFYPLLAGLAAFGLAHLLSNGTGEYNFIDAAALSLNMLSVGQLINALLISFGVMIIFIRFDITWEEKVFLVIIGLMVLMGGVNTVRFIYWAAPVVILMIVNELKHVRKYWIALMLIPQIYFAHLFEGFYTDLTAYTLWGGLQLYRPDYKLTLAMFSIASGFYLLRKFKVVK